MTQRVADERIVAVHRQLCPPHDVREPPWSAPADHGNLEVHSALEKELTDMSLSSHEEPLSPYEKTILAAVEEELRAGDPSLAAALSQDPPSSATTAPSPVRHGREHAGSSWSALPAGTRYGMPLLAVVLFLAAQPLMPPSWRAVLGVALWLVVLPLAFLWFFGTAERRGARHDGPTP